jgi:hypothetical protein
MLTDKFRHIPLATSATVLMAGLGCWLLATPRAGALVDTAHVLSGGGTIGAQTLFTSPGNSTAIGIDFPAAGLGEIGAQVLMPAGTLSKLRVKITTETAPSSGALTVMVRVNGADTVLTCQLAATGQCSSGNKVKGLANNSPLAIRVANNLVDSGQVAYTYSLQFD